MEILFVHKNYPAQFGHLAEYLTREHGYRCTFVTNKPGEDSGGVHRIHYEPRGGATQRTHYFSRTFENAVAHAHGVYEACKSERPPAPDLVVGHSGFGSTLFLRELYDCPIINYFEYFYHPRNSDLDFRPDFPPKEPDVLRAYCRNAMLLLDLQNCDAGYSPTRWQKSRFPERYHEKLEVIFDGVDTDVWRPREDLPRAIGKRAVEPETRIVTYVSRGFESIRGFDIFMRVAKRISAEMPNVLFVCVGDDRAAYGGDTKYIREDSFLKHTLAQDDYDLSRFLFTGLIPRQRLAEVLCVSDLHIYLTAPFVLSWSLFNALACGCTVVASDTPPVRELVTHERTGLLADFFDVDGLSELALRVLRDPEGHRALGEAGAALIEAEYALSRTLPQMIRFYERVARKGT